VTSAIWYNKLPADVQLALREEALNAGDLFSQGTIASLGRYAQQFREKGLTVSEIDVAPFREATKVVYDKLGYADLRKQVDAVLR